MRKNVMVRLLLYATMVHAQLAMWLITMMMVPMMDTHQYRWMIDDVAARAAAVVVVMVGDHYHWMNAMSSIHWLDRRLVVVMVPLVRLSHHYQHCCVHY